MGRTKVAAIWRWMLMYETNVKRNKNLRPAVFVDRDGTLINDIGYLGDPDGLSFYPGIPEALRRLQDRGYLIVVVTNQSGIGRGYFNEETAIAVNCAMLRMLRDKGVMVAAIYYCPHHPDEGCSCRKPGQLMILRALKDLDIDDSLSWIVGDMDKDIWTGINAGLRPILVETGKSEKGSIPAHVKRSASVVEAVNFILDEGIS
jgi:histidinol-phosphate phosphatase family protein